MVYYETGTLSNGSKVMMESFGTKTASQWSAAAQATPRACGRQR